ncbi:MAG: hypothetical protein V1886_01675 [archaeon]
MKIIDSVIGLVVLFMGLLPLLGKIEQFAYVSGVVGQPGSNVYQAVLIVLGALVLVYSAQKEKK